MLAIARTLSPEIPEIVVEIARGQVAGEQSLRLGGQAAASELPAQLEAQRNRLPAQPIERTDAIGRPDLREMQDRVRQLRSKASPVSQKTAFGAAVSAEAANVKRAHLQAADIVD